ncbi:MAG: hypothetical protein IPG48_18800 [Saprospiraceae bacterium]|nr:hypothetical protein [Saprospiraceae bacterium]
MDISFYYSIIIIDFNFRQGLPIILAVVLVFIVLHFYKTGFNKVFIRIIALIFVIFSFFFSNFHILNKKLISNKYLEETQYIDPDKSFHIQTMMFMAIGIGDKKSMV